MIVIIGATSFIGMYTTEAFLKAGYQVLGTGRNAAARRILQSMGADFTELDVTNPNDFERLPTAEVEGVVHLAAFLPSNAAVDLTVDESIADCFKVNILGAINTLEYCRRNKIRRMLGACSFRDVSGAWGQGRIITEDEPRSFSFTGDHASYIISKNAANDIMNYYNQQHNMQCACFRLPQVYGVGPNNINAFFVDGKRRKSGVATFIERVMNGEDIELWGDPRIKKDSVYVKDVAQAYVKVMQSDHTLGLYNISGHMQVTLEDQARAVIQIFGGAKQSRIVYRPDKQVYQRKPYLYSIDKARRDFGYEPQYTDFVKIMEDYKRELDSGRWDEWLASRK